LVNSLQPNTKYYFKIRSGNGCATGNWSNEISAQTKFISLAGASTPFQQPTVSDDTGTKITTTSKPSNNSENSEQGTSESTGSTSLKASPKPSPSATAKANEVTQEKANAGFSIPQPILIGGGAISLLLGGFWFFVRPRMM
jgi:cobalamin biosynthesis Mg chelatase CobN